MSPRARSESMIAPSAATVRDRSPPPSWSSTTLPVSRPDSVSLMIESTGDGLPILRVVAQAHRVVALARRDPDGLKLVRGRRGCITEVGRAEERRPVVQHRFEQALGGIELEPRPLVRHQREVGMGIGVTADLVSFVVDPPRQEDVRVDVLADDEERGRHVAGAQRVEDHRRPRPVRPIVERQRDLVLALAVAIDDVGRRVRGDRIADDEPRGGVDADDAAAGRWATPGPGGCRRRCRALSGHRCRRQAARARADDIVDELHVVARGARPGGCPAGHRVRAVPARTTAMRPPRRAARSPSPATPSSCPTRSSLYAVTPSRYQTMWSAESGSVQAM